MGCGSCSTGACSATGGCGKSGGCASGGCNKLNTYDWFAGMTQPTQSEYENVYEVRFKNTRKEFFRNVNGLSLITGDFVAVESDRGFDVGQVSLGGILAQLQMKKKRVNPKSDRVKKIYRLARKEDLEKLTKARSREKETMVRTRAIIRSLNLDMKLSDVEFQGDNTKAIFYYIADQRVDFRELIKIIATEFRIRVEMKQIGLRYESGLVGGIGSCGRELCCSTWLTDFKSVSTAAARYQNLSLNPMKISGQCGRLKCCLNFELDSYMDALQHIPKVDFIETEIGRARLQKTDIFKGSMWFSYENENTWLALDVAMVKELVAMNKAGKKPASLRALMQEVPEDIPLDFVDVVGQSTLREDPRRGKRKSKKKRTGNRQGGNAQGGNNQGNSRNSRSKNAGGQGNKSASSQPNPEAKAKEGEARSKKPSNRRPKPKTGGAQGGNSRGPRRKPRNPNQRGGGSNPQGGGEGQ